MIKIIVTIAFVVIILSLGSALYHLIKYNKDEEHSKKIVQALTLRIVLSVILFIFIFVAIATGLYKPGGIGKNMQMQRQLHWNQQQK